MFMVKPLQSRNYALKYEFNVYIWHCSLWYLRKNKLNKLGPPVLQSSGPMQCLQLKIRTKNVQNQTINGPNFNEKTD